MRTRQQCEQRMREIRDGMARIARYERPTVAQTRQFEALEAEFDNVDAERLALTDAEELASLRAQLAAGTLDVERGSSGHDDPRDARGNSAGYRSAGRDDAHRTLETLTRSGVLGDDAAERVTAMLDTGPRRDRSAAAEWVRVAGDPAYAAAFVHLLRDPANGHRRWSAQEADAYRAAQDWREEQRAMSLDVDTAGGVLAPLIVDPSITLTNAGTVSPIRQVARVETVVTDAWRGITAAGVTAEWHAEGAEVANAQPVLANPVVPVHTLDVYTQFSYELAQDATSLLAELQVMFADAADRRQAAAFISGTGTGQPQGLVTGLAGVPASVLGPTTPETLGAGDVFRVQNALPPRWQPNAQWIASLGVLNTIAQFTGDVGNRLAEELITGRLLRRPVSEVSDLPGAPNTGVTAAGAGALIYGDMRAGYLIAQRAGTAIELHSVTGPQGRPTMQRGILMWQRVGAGVIVPEALRMLSIPTAV